MIAPRDVPRILKLKRSGYTWAGIALAMGCSEAIARQAVNQRARADKVRQMIAADPNWSANLQQL